MNPRRAKIKLNKYGFLGVLLVVMVTGITAVGPSLGAHADPAPITVDDIEYTANTGTPATATVTGYTGDGTTPAIIQNTVTIGGTPYTVTTIGDSAFENANVTSVDIPSSVTAIGNDAFNGSDLTSVTILRSVTSLGGCALSGNDLTAVTTPTWNGYTPQPQAATTTGTQGGTNITSASINPTSTPNALAATGTTLNDFTLVGTGAICIGAPIMSGFMLDRSRRKNSRS